MVFFALLTVALGSFAQSTFTEATFKELLEEYKKDSKAFMINRLSEDFRYINSKGKFLKKQDIITNDGEKIVMTEVLQPIIFYSADLGIISGIHKTAAVRSDGREVQREIPFTYTFQKRNGKWMFVASQHGELEK